MMKGASIDPDVSDYNDHFVDLPPANSSGNTIKNEPAAPSSNEQEFSSKSTCSNDSFEPSVPELDVSEVFDAELRRQRLETLKSEKRMFDKWTEMAAAHIKTYEEMVSIQRETLQ
ncbi:hypothetical protein GCK32_005043 [Trichostrongylus colubriformis]|uniref:Uncharacterized protein n=1 Tax=Trichostrongylus colubriformis TaxID=6319 RepID=A0AAN8ICQ2_TRICO